jgi:hypothetical protein
MGGCNGIYVQRFDSKCRPQGDKVHVNDYQTGNQVNPSISQLANGEFIVCWESMWQDGTFSSIFARRFSENCEKLGQEFRANADAENRQEWPGVTGLADGGFVICWRNWAKYGTEIQVRAHFYDAAGHSIGNDIRVDSFQGDKYNIRAAGLSDGSVLICWQSDLQDGWKTGIYGQQFTSTGEPIGDEFRVNDGAIGRQETPAIAGLTVGGFVICWMADSQTPTGHGIYIRRYDANCQPMSKEFRITNYMEHGQKTPDVHSLPSGGFVVCWSSLNQDGSGLGVFAKRFPDKPLARKLEPFELLEPSFDATLETAKPLLKWQKANNEALVYPWELLYIVSYDTLSNFSTAFEVNVGLDTALQVPALKKGKTWFWRVLAKNYYGDSLSSDTGAFFISPTATNITDMVTAPDRHILLSNFPNPFNPSTTITFELPHDGFVSIKIYDLTGRLVRTLMNEQKLAGLHAIQWNGTDDVGHKVAAGVYLYQIEFTNSNGETMTLTKKMSLVK